MGEFRTCPACGYGRGFHIFFRDDEEGTKIGLICPSCGQSYDLGWATREIPGMDADKGPVYENRD